MSKNHHILQENIDPFHVTPFPFQLSKFLIFLALLPFSFPFIFLGTFGGLIVTFFYRRLSLPNKDRAARFLSWLFKVGTRVKIELKDHNQSRKDHSRLYVSPHICMAEVNLLMISLGHIRIITADFSRTIPIFKHFVEALDPIYVARGKNKKNAPSAFELLKKSIEETEYRHMIFPEGTYTNGKTLIQFKTGAFALGIPVTPVVFHYPKYVPFWNRQESNIFTQFYRLMAQVYTPIIVEILPTYTPSEEERTDPKLYAENVRNVMAKATNRPLSDKSLQDSPNYKKDVQSNR